MVPRHNKSVQLPRVHPSLCSNTTTYYFSPRYSKEDSIYSLQHTKCITITWCSAHAQHTSLLFFHFVFVIPSQQHAFLCSNNIPHKCTGFKPCNLATKDQIIVSLIWGQLFHELFTQENFVLWAWTRIYSCLNSYFTQVKVWKASLIWVLYLCFFSFFLGGGA